MSKPRVCVLGLGTVGYPTATYIAKKGFEVYGYDIDDKAVARAKGVKANADWDKIPVCDTYVICVSTFWGNEGPDVSPVLDVCKRIADKRRTALVCVESTVNPGTCRRVSESLGLRHVAHVPHRYWASEPEKHGVRQRRVIGALDQESMKAASQFYGALEVPLYPVSSLEVAETVKCVENAYRYVQIAFVEELWLICRKLGISFEEVRNGANTKWNVELMEARDGIKGHCLSKDIRYLLHEAGWDAPLLDGAIKADARYLAAKGGSKQL